MSCVSTATRKVAIQYATVDIHERMSLVRNTSYAAATCEHRHSCTRCSGTHKIIYVATAISMVNNPAPVEVKVSLLSADKECIHTEEHRQDDNLNHALLQVRLLVTDP